MSNYDPEELLVLWDPIMEDPELTYNGSTKWRKASADGKITKTEARQVARLIFQIGKEAAKREAEQALAQAVEIASKAARTF